VARSQAEKVVATQAQQLDEQRTLRREQVEVGMQLAQPILVDCEPAARFFVECFDAQVEQWRSRGMILKVEPGEDLGDMFGIERRLRSRHLRQVTLENGTIIRLITVPGYFEAAKLIEPWLAYVEYRPRDGHDRGQVRLQCGERLTRIEDWRETGRAGKIVWSGAGSAVKDEAFREAVAIELSATIFEALTRAPGVSH
jgi:hypothetical protein